jgi:hypothetical protein
MARRSREGAASLPCSPGSDDHSIRPGIGLEGNKQVTDVDPVHTSAMRIDKLLKVVQRDLAPMVLGFGFQVEERTRARIATRFQRNWEELCQLDLDAAAAFYHGVREMDLLMARYGQPFSPADQLGRQDDEAGGILEIGRRANPDAQVATLGELYELGQQAIADEINSELDAG